MTAISKNDFLKAALDTVSEFPTVALYVNAGDPRVLAQLGANATMLSMISTQIDADKFEPFVKARDGTVLADASLKGILPLGRACQVTLAVQNNDAGAITLGAQRRLLDQRGRLYELDATVTIAPGATVNVTAQQLRRRSIRHTVTAATDFYQIRVPLTADDMYLNTMAVSKGLQEFAYAPDWFNVGIGDFAYQVEVDELRQMFIRFGKSTVIGYGVQTGDEFVLDITECNGQVADLPAGGDFNLEYVFAAGETSTKINLVSVEDHGAAPNTMQELRVMARYPAIFDHNAVYLGEFDFLLRRYMAGIRFLSVWNEQVEEGVRGASADNINTLFVSGLVTGMTAGEFENRARSLIKRADDSYKISFVDSVLSPVPCTITGSIAISWGRATVESQIRALLLSYYGDGAINVSEGMKMPIKKAQINRLLRENIDALRDDNANYDVALTLPTTLLPEQFLYIAPGSLTVSLTSEDYGTNLWNH